MTFSLNLVQKVPLCNNPEKFAGEQNPLIYTIVQGGKRKISPMDCFGVSYLFFFYQSRSNCYKNINSFFQFSFKVLKKHVFQLNTVYCCFMKFHIRMLFNVTHLSSLLKSGNVLQLRSSNSLPLGQPSTYDLAMFKFEKRFASPCAKQLPKSFPCI